MATALAFKPLAFKKVPVRVAELTFALHMPIFPRARINAPRIKGVFSLPMLEAGLPLPLIYIFVLVNHDSEASHLVIFKIAFVQGSVGVVNRAKPLLLILLKMTGIFFPVGIDIGALTLFFRVDEVAGVLFIGVLVNVSAKSVF